MKRHLGSITLIAVGAATALFGLGILNYTDPTPPAKLEHHRQVAVEHGLPEPSTGLRGIGLGTAILGIATVASAALALFVARVDEGR